MRITRNEQERRYLNAWYRSYEVVVTRKNGRNISLKDQKEFGLFKSERASWRKEINFHAMSLEIAKARINDLKRLKLATVYDVRIYSHKAWEYHHTKGYLAPIYTTI